MSRTSDGQGLHRTLPLPGNIPQIEGLQQLRCIAAALVAWVHATQQLSLERGVTLPSLGVFGVDIFFVLSGFIISGSVLREKQPAPHSAWGFLKRRLVRIYPIYWAICALGLVRLVFQHKALNSHLVGAFLLLPNFSNWGDMSLIDGSWTLVFEIFFYAVLFVCMLVLNRARAIVALIATLTAAAVTGALWHVSAPTWNVLLNPILLEFIAGALLALVFAHTRQRAWLGGTLLLAGTALALWCGAHNPGATGMQMVLANQQVPARLGTWGVAAWLVVAGVVLGGLMIRGPVGRLLTVLGNASYSAYLLEMYSVVYVLRLATHVFRGPQLTTGAAVAEALSATAGALLLGWLSYQWVEWPMLRFLNRRLITHPSR